jgi:hypothetical protein
LLVANYSANGFILPDGKLCTELELLGFNKLSLLIVDWSKVAELALIDEVLSLVAF